MSDPTKWDLQFTPSYTPLEMLKLGVFEGKYINNIKGIPSSWKSLPKVVGPKDPPDVSLNKYGVKSRQPLSAWKEKGWLTDNDPNGWYISNGMNQLKRSLCHIFLPNQSFLITGF